MNQHGNGAQNPTHFGLNGAGARFWTLTWLVQKNYGQITVEMVQEWRRTHFIYDASGTRHDHVEIGGNQFRSTWYPIQQTCAGTAPGQLGCDTNVGINTYVSLSVRG